jgi:prolyl-tRNA editing enzyme YbaK/EbsC (Cys-tRNA(Pro) deacylase)
MSNLEKATVKRVRNALIDLELPDNVIELAMPSYKPETATALGVETGAIVKTLVYSVGNRYVLVFVANDHDCQIDQLPRTFALEGSVVRPGVDLVRAVTGFSIGSVAPIGLVSKLPTAIDASLKKYEKIYVSAGDPHCVFETTMDQLKQLTQGVVSYAVAKPKK